MSKILGNGKPTNTTPGIVGQEYLDKASGITYVCTKVNHVPGEYCGESDGVYTWEEAGGASSWNDLKDKPFGYESLGSIVFDGTLPVSTIISNYTTCAHEGESQMKEDLGDNLVAVFCVKISDDFYSKAELSSATITAATIINGEHEGYTEELSFGSFDADETTVYARNSSVISTRDPIKINEGQGWNFPSAGTYVVYSSVINPEDGSTMVYYIEKIEFPQTIKPLDEKFMPTLTSPNGTKFKLSVADDGTISATEITE